MLVGLFVGIAGVGLIGAGLRFAWSAWPEDVRELWANLSTTLLMHGVVFALAAWLVWANRLTWAAAFGIQQRGSLRAVLWGVGSLGVTYPGALALQWLSLTAFGWFQATPAPQLAVRMLSEAGGWWPRLCMGIQTIGTAPLAEELLFRGILYVSIKQAGYPRLAWWGVALLFGLSHGHLPTLLPLSFFGLALAWLYERTGSLLAPLVAHAGFNAVNFIRVVLEGTPLG